MEKKRLLFRCSYEGSPFRGWQSQACGQGIQDHLERAFAQILGHAPRIAASGRTDAGVHALAQYFHCDLPREHRLPHEAWLRALNAHLPAQLRVNAAQEIPLDFHARFNALKKSYHYLIEPAVVLSPFWHGRVWHMAAPFNAETLAEALALYQGEHNFRMFAAKRGNEPEPLPEGYHLRHIYRAELKEKNGLLRIKFKGNGFMYRMVRLLVGSAMQVARGSMPMEQLAQMLHEPHATNKSRYCAPAQGLYLASVKYGSGVGI